jgi:hypothetical protein
MHGEGGVRPSCCPVSGTLPWLPLTVAPDLVPLEKPSSGPPSSLVSIRVHGEVWSEYEGKSIQLHCFTLHIATWHHVPCYRLPVTLRMPAACHPALPVTLLACLPAQWNLPCTLLSGVPV